MGYEYDKQKVNVFKIKYFKSLKKNRTRRDKIRIEVIVKKEV